MLITDGLRPMGLPNGKYVYDGLEFLSVDGVAKYEDGTLVGTSVGMSELVGRFVRFTGIPLRSIAKVASYNLLGCSASMGLKGA